MTWALIAFAIAAGLAHWAVRILEHMPRASAVARLVAIGPVLAALASASVFAAAGFHLAFLSDLAPLWHLIWTFPISTAVSFWIIARLAAHAAELRRDKNPHPDADDDQSDGDDPEQDDR